MVFAAGQRLKNGQYQIERSLNEGRVGISYLAKTKEGDRVVVKTLRDPVLAQLTPEQRTKINNKLMDEAVKLAGFSHPHIVRCRGSFMEQGQACLVMDFVAGDDLASLPTATLPEAEALDYIAQVGEALKVVHAQGLVHRDIKPANIMLRAGSAEAVLIDFGLTKGFNETLTSIKSSNTDGFTALELYDPTEKARPYSDVYSLAATLYALLSGTVPPHAEERSRQLRQNQVLGAITGVSDATNAAIQKGMAVDYGDQPQSIEAFLQLLPLPSSPNPVPSPVPTPTSDPDRLNRYTLYATIASIIVAIILGIFAQDIRSGLQQWLTPSPPKPETTTTPQP